MEYLILPPGEPPETEFQYMFLNPEEIPTDIPPNRTYVVVVESVDEEARIIYLRYVGESTDGDGDDENS